MTDFRNHRNGIYKFKMDFFISSTHKSEREMNLIQINLIHVTCFRLSITENEIWLKVAINTIRHKPITQPSYIYQVNSVQNTIISTTKNSEICLGNLEANLHLKLKPISSWNKIKGFSHCKCFTTPPPPHPLSSPIVIFIVTAAMLVGWNFENVFSTDNWQRPSFDYWLLVSEEMMFK